MLFIDLLQQSYFSKLCCRTLVDAIITTKSVSLYAAFASKVAVKSNIFITYLHYTLRQRINHMFSTCHLFFDIYFFSYFDPTFPSTTATVLNKILISSPGLHFLIYSVSSLTTSSKSVILLLPLTCHIPVSPGLNASLER